MNKQDRHIIWTNYDLDYDRDWKEDLEREFPFSSDDDRIAMMYEMNDRYLYDERMNLDFCLSQPIIVIADLGLWYGRRNGYRELQTGRVKDCLCSERGINYVTWYVDYYGDLRCDAIHHDGVNRLLYRVYRDDATPAQIENLKKRILEGTANRKEIRRVTDRIGDKIANIYGFNVYNNKAAAF